MTHLLTASVLFAAFVSLPVAYPRADGANPNLDINALSIGSKVPEITGVDLDGKAMRLSDFRGRVVLLVFAGDWCGICRSEYPYERLLEELYRNWPFSIVGVNSDVDVLAAKRGLTASRLSFRSWWDGTALNGHGEIAKTWGVRGWPTTYLIDADGVIRFVDLRSEDLLKAVKQLLAEGPLKRD
jgi:peroxiredoxin